jgi:hypothetical protein
MIDRATAMAWARWWTTPDPEGYAPCDVGQAAEYFLAHDGRVLDALRDRWHGSTELSLIEAAWELERISVEDLL